MEGACFSPRMVSGLDWRYYGAMTARFGPKPIDPPVRFWTKVEFTDTCWLWTAKCLPNGYGRFRIGSLADGTRDEAYAHRWAYEFCIAPIPSGLTIDHLCRVRHCVRPDHLEPVTQQINNLRSDGPSGAHARATHCIHGHPFTEDNTYVRPQGWRECRTCVRRRLRDFMRLRH